MYGEKTSKLLNNIPATILEPKPNNRKNKIKMLLAYILYKWYINKLRTKTPPYKHSKINK